MTSECLLAFFDRRPNGTPPFNGPSPDHTEVVLGGLEVLFEADKPGDELSEY
jgi:hypothetical protein